MRLTFMHNRITEIKNIQKHRKEVQRIAKEKGYSFLSENDKCFYFWR